ncbi:hypothetical protein AURDEDRAFT_161827 [Auricularia subglabra TFB-10046 SS5]|nr:hypothetical protein AURDEDRAFT_161827 [Auricularia subglabra TFB-10046 SS5]
MLSFILKLAILLTVAGHALALNISFPDASTTITAQGLLSVPEGPYTQICAPKCGLAMKSIMSCSPTDSKCLCEPSTATMIQDCEQCYLDFLVRTNTEPSDPRLGSAAALGAYATACSAQANVTLAVALGVSPGLNGLVVEVLNTPATVVVVGFGGVLGAALMYIMSNLS